MREAVLSATVFWIEWHCVQPVHQPTAASCNSAHISGVSVTMGDRQRAYCHKKLAAATVAVAAAAAAEFGITWQMVSLTTLLITCTKQTAYLPKRRPKAKLIQITDNTIMPTRPNGLNILKRHSVGLKQLGHVSYNSSFKTKTRLYN